MASLQWDAPKYVIDRINVHDDIIQIVPHD